jgi:hypothetical protein
MLFEELIVLLLLGSGVFLIGVPFYRLIRKLIPHKRDPLKEAQERLEQARLEVEAARLNKEAEKLYSQMYDESLDDNDDENNTQNRRRF